jgi:hypothetical protein
MSATNDEVREFFNNGSGLVSKWVGNVAGAGLGLAIIGPPGAILGASISPFIEHYLSRLTGEFVKRQMGQRQTDRAAAGIILLQRAISARIEKGEPLRGEDFTSADESGRSAADELGEQAVFSIIASIEERRIPFLANFYTSLYFDTEIDRLSVPALVKIADGITYRAMCILSVVGSGKLYTGKSREHGETKPWPIDDHFIAKAVFDLQGIVVQRDSSDQAGTVMLGYDDVDPFIMELSQLGHQIYDKMGLAGIPTSDPDIEKTMQALKRIAAAPLAGPDLVKALEDGLNPGL